jgi:hypothetical protein
MVRYTLEQRAFLYDTYVKYRSGEKSRRKFHDERVPSRQTIHNLVNKLTTMGLLIDKKMKHKHQVLTEEKLDDIRARLECQETGVLKSSARTATQLLKLRRYKTTVIQALQQSDSASRGSFLQLVSTVCRLA